MHDEVKYPNSHEFDGFRFVEGHPGGVAGSSVSEVRGSSFTDASKEYPIWGLGSKAW